MDITYVPMARGFVYLAAVIDWFSRRVLSHRVSITMEADFCVEALEEALARHGRPEIFNTDQGSQFTSEAFTGVLIKNGVAISMDGKGSFFLPLMFTYVCQEFDAFLSRGMPALDSFKAAYDYSYDFLYFVDVCFATAGYGFSLRLIDTHLRSTEPTALGWMAALLCYEPFWSLIGTQYLAYDPGHPWGEWLRDDPLLFGIWGSLILALVAVYVWATIMFGCRFSNLTNRGILTNGPYRFTKHPAYIAKNLSWWMVSLPFLGDGGWQAVRHAALLLMLNGVYALRAWTEERHLSRDTAYVAYMSWIKRNGLFRFFGSARAAATWGRARVIRERP